MTSVQAPVHYPHGPIPPKARQPVLDAAAVLQVRRSEIAARLAVGCCPEAEVVGVGGAGINQWLFEDAHHWRELVSTRPAVTLTQIRISLPGNRYILERGCQMLSLFDYDGTEPAARTALANEALGTYLFGSCPVQMKIVDRRFVLLQGPEVDGEPSVMRVTSTPVLEAAWRYWEAAVASVVPVEPTQGATALTPRQLQVVGLLAADMGDDAIASFLGVSVRTIRSDIAAVLESVGARSRFAAGLRLRNAQDDAS